ncbi:hypothetical protein [Pontibacter litorisediminis]|uniref:hypothetical protein n=1 Tax=Pontibacter litorisediminis TaxID=1846260 RepID=UPI0023EC71BA|nr:hypothetical protein [Pontibacter litorisediminis]
MPIESAILIGKAPLHLLTSCRALGYNNLPTPAPPHWALFVERVSAPDTCIFVGMNGAYSRTVPRHRAIEQ